MQLRRKKRRKKKINGYFQHLERYLSDRDRDSNA